MLFMLVAGALLTDALRFIDMIKDYSSYSFAVPYRA